MPKTSISGRRPREAEQARADGLRGPVPLAVERLRRVASIRDLTLRRRAERSELELRMEHAAREAAESAARRAEFLAEASRILSSSFDYDTTLARFARLAVPFLGDFCVIDVVDRDDTRRVATAHADPEKEALVKRLERFPPHLSRPSNPILRALRTRKTVLAGPEELLPAGITIDAEHRAVLERLDPRSGVFAPMYGQDGLVGVVSFLSGGRERAYGTDEIALAEDLANRAALAIGNARLFHQAQQATRARDDVLAVVAHDLRNPLSVVRNAAEMMLELVADDGLRRYPEMIRRSADTMNRMIEDLLEVARLDSRRLTLDLAEWRAAALVGEAISMLRPLAEARGIDLSVDPLPEAWRVRADSARVLQVFSNLLGNAIKFTPSGGRISLSFGETEAEVRFAIADSGPGIPPEKLPHVFGRFWQADASDGRGLGLGLAIAKSLVEAHGGRIWIESRAGEGTTVYFTLPKPMPPVA
jgi:signal transduction histidine kinase